MMMMEMMENNRKRNLEDGGNFEDYISLHMHK